MDSTDECPEPGQTRMISAPKVVLTVQETGRCYMLKKGDRWVMSGREVDSEGIARLCGMGVCSLFPQIKAILLKLQPGDKLPEEPIVCDAPACEAKFNLEFAPKPPATRQKASKTAKVPHDGTAVAGSTRRLERGAAAATSVLRKGTPFLMRLPKELARDLVLACKTNRHTNGEKILAQGVQGQHLYIVADGNVEVVRTGEKGDETILVTLAMGDCFGEMSILTGEMTSAEVRSRGVSTVLSLHKDQLDLLLMRQPALSREFSKLLADRLKATNVSLESELSRGILGKLSMIALVDLVQTLHQSRRTGTLVLNYMGKQARIGFKNGTLCTAQVGDLLGEEAFYEVVGWPDGDFCFEQTEPSTEDSGQVKMEMMGLMMEGMRRMDEKRAAAETAQKTEQGKTDAVVS